MRGLMVVTGTLFSLFLTYPAFATLQIAATVNGNTFLCVDNNASCDNNAAVGTIALSSQTLGGVIVDGSIQTSVGTPGVPGPLDILNASSLSIINTNAVTVNAQVTVSDTNFTAPVTQAALSASGTWENAVGSSITLQWYGDVANTQGADTSSDTPGVLLDSFTNTPLVIADSLSHNNVVGFIANSPFSMTETANITLAANASLISRGQTIIAAVETPEPASMLLMTAGLLGLGMIRRSIK